MDRQRTTIVYWRDMVIVRSSLITFMKFSVLRFRVQKVKDR
jgi:hypothetical protein